MKRTPPEAVVFAGMNRARPCRAALNNSPATDFSGAFTVTRNCLDLLVRDRAAPRQMPIYAAWMKGFKRKAGNSANTHHMSRHPRQHGFPVPF